MTIIAKLSFWILKPAKKSTNSKLLLWKNPSQPFDQLIMDALHQFEGEGYVEKLKACFASVSLPSDHPDLSGFLYDLIAQI